MIGFILLIVIVIYLLSASMKKQNREIASCNDIVKEEREYLKKLNVEFTSAHEYINVTQHRGILFVVDEKEKFVYICDAPDKVAKIPFSEIIGSQTIIDSQVTGSIGRAVVGSAIAGGAGAIVGAATAKKKVYLLKVTIVRENIAESQKDIVLIDTGIKTIDGDYTKGLRFAESVQSSIKAIMSLNDKESSERYNSRSADLHEDYNSNAGTIADELLKLKSLLDSGVLSQEEFDQQKQRLLNSN